MSSAFFDYLDARSKLQTLHREGAAANTINLFFDTQALMRQARRVLDSDASARQSSKTGGGLLGFAVAGPLGAVLGSSLGDSTHHNSMEPEKIYKEITELASTSLRLLHEQAKSHDPSKSDYEKHLAAQAYGYMHDLYEKLLEFLPRGSRFASSTLTHRFDDPIYDLCQGEARRMSVDEVITAEVRANLLQDNPSRTFPSK